MSSAKVKQVKGESAKNAHEGWLMANQSALKAAMAMVRVRLSFHADQNNGESPEAAQQIEEAARQYRAVAESMSPPPALEQLVTIFDLSQFERDVLLLCAGIDLESTFATLCASAQGNKRAAYPTFSLALAALPQAYWSAVSPEAPLRKWRLIEFATPAHQNSAPVTTRPLRIAERILHFLNGVQYMDESLAEVIEQELPVKAQTLTPGHQQMIDLIIQTLARAAVRGPLPAIVLNGPDSQDAIAIAAAVCDASTLSLYSVPLHPLSSNTNELRSLIRLWEREAALIRGALLLDCGAGDLEDTRDTIITEFVERVAGVLFIASREPRKTIRRRTVSFDVSAPPLAEQRAVWAAAFGESLNGLSGRLDELLSQFRLSAPAIFDIAADAHTALTEADAFDALWGACRRQTRTRLAGLAERIEPAAGWDDLVLPGAQKETLRHIGTHVRQRTKVYDAWGFATKGARGLGISALFTGASGTGKTMAAEVLANELRLDLYRIDLSAVVSKYVGETEKNLRGVFDAAEMGGAILLFDEADALFGKRSEVKDSHDRYANIEVSYLLQRMESYRGLAILTTNLKSALDQAFLRRIRFVVQFPFPDAMLRAEIWRRIFPPAVPHDELSYDRLAQLNMAGGNIRNIALHAAFLAADADEKVGMRHLLAGTRVEYAKLEKTLTEAEIMGWD